MVEYEFARPIVTVGVALFKLNAARKGAWALPGTYVHVDEDADLESAAIRVLREKCGLAGLFVELRTYSGRARDRAAGRRQSCPGVSLKSQ